MIEALAQHLIVKIIVAGAAVLTSIRYGTGLYFWRETEKLERPKYTVIQKLSNGVELRRYEPYLIAETTVDGMGFREPTREGFRACAGYIFGKNKPARSSSSTMRSLSIFGSNGGQPSSEKMAMTAPVRISSTVDNTSSSSRLTDGEKMAMTAPVRVSGTGGGTGQQQLKQAKHKTKVSFVIGSQYSLKTAPQPLNKNVKLRQVPPHTLAVKNFSGKPPSDERVQQEREKIEQALLKANVQPKSGETLVYGYHDPFITPSFLRRNEVALVVEGSV